MGKDDEMTGLEGCYGPKVNYGKLNELLEINFRMNTLSENDPHSTRFSQCIWGHSGTGKTSIVKQYAEKPVVFEGKEYPGYDVRDVPVAQFEEMGDLHGIPMDALLCRKGEEERWVPQREQILVAFKEDGWTIDTSVEPRSIMAPPDWVPLKPGPAILLLDDWNRASIRILKGIMQLLQNYQMVSWELPKGCNIVMTGNPDQQSYLVSTIDSAILTRIKHMTLLPDPKEWVVWAEKVGLDPRGISFLLYDPEAFIGAVGEGDSRTNPRTWSEFFRFTKDHIKDVKEESKMVNLYGQTLLDDTSIATFISFCSRKLADVIEPMEILDGKPKDIAKRVAKLMSGKESRTDILGVIFNRLYATVVNDDVEQTDSRIKNFQEFVTNSDIPEDLRYTVCNRIARHKNGTNRNHKWIIGHKQLKKFILDTILT